MASEERPWRCFVAVPIGDDLRGMLRQHVAGLQARPDLSRDWRWSDAEGWHVTLAFLGATEPSAVARLGESLRAAVSGFEPLVVSGRGLGTFPSRRRARVLWYGIADPAGRLRDLSRAIREATGLAPEDRFHAHLTLARARDRSGADAAPALRAGPPPEATVAVDRVNLYRSHMGRGPARYEVLATAPLGGDSA